MYSQSCIIDHWSHINWRPGGPSSRAPYSYRKEKETHELIFSWLSWLAVLLIAWFLCKFWHFQMAVTSLLLGLFAPNLGILWNSVCSFTLCGSMVANPIIYRFVLSPPTYEIRQWAHTNDDGGDNGVTPHGSHTQANWLTGTCSLGLPCTSLIWYWTSMLWSIDTCLNKVSADQYHVVAILQAQVFSSSRSQVFLEVERWPSAGFPIGSRAHVRLTCWKQGRIVLKPD